MMDSHVTKRTLAFTGSASLLRIWWLFQGLLILLYLPAGLCKNYCGTQEVYDNVVPHDGKDSGVFTPQEILATGLHFPTTDREIMAQCIKICCQMDTCDAAYVFDRSCYTLECVSEDACSPVEGSVQGTSMAFVSRASPSFSEESYVLPRNLNDICNPKIPNPCGLNEECVGMVGKKGKLIYQCQCINGYERDASDTCIDVSGIEYGIPSDYDSDYNSFNFKSAQKAQKIKQATMLGKPIPKQPSEPQLHFCDQHSPCDSAYEYCHELFYGTGVCKCKRGYHRNPNTDACEIPTPEPASNPSISTKPVSDDSLSTALSSEGELGSVLTERSQETAAPQNLTTVAETSDGEDLQVTAAADQTDDEVVPNPSKKNKGQNGDTATTAVPEVIPTVANETAEEEGNETDAETIPTEAMTPQPPHVTTKVVTEPVVALSVSAGNDKVLQLPDEDSVSLFAYVLPEPSKEINYQYEWTLVSAPKGSSAGVMEGKHQRRCNLSKLTAGQYMFKVTVTGDHALGEAFVNVTVLPKPRVNSPPVAVISPKKQEVNLPNSETVLDGSQSTDDDQIVSYHWEEIKGPLREQKTIGDEALLTMTDLVAGDYIIQLTVTDSDGVTSSTTANVTVHEEVDYPPSANAGTNRALKLPKNSVILNGSLSSDDKGIAQYEWSKDSGGVADMQGTSSKILHLSNLEEGVYVFTLKVTDTAGHEDSSSVTVVVQPENNSPPVAIAGPDKEISLPNDETVLDGSQSTDDQEITSYSWEKQSGPGDVTFKNADKARAIISSLQPGTYVFQLTVTDAKGATGTDTVTVVVKQEVNEPPVANAGGDMSVQLPQKYVEVDGSKSHDDMGIVSYEWTRSGKSPAAGEILSGSDHEAILKLTNLVVGRYIFTLKVTDAKNMHDSDTVTVEVEQDVNMVNLVEIHIVADIRSFTRDNKDALVRQLSVLVGVMDADIKVQSVRESPLGGVVLEFYVLSADATKVLKGISIVNKLRQKLHKESQVLDFHVIKVDTVVCQNDCSGHGTCNIETKECVCESFWMENFFRVYIGDGEANCEWSILYVVIIISLIVVTLGVLIWAIICCVKRRRVKIRKRHRYSILDDFDDGEALEMLPKSKNGKHNSSIMISESDSDEDTLYENKKSNGYKPNRPRPLNGLIAARKSNKRKDSRSLKPLLQQQSINQSESL